MSIDAVTAWSADRPTVHLRALRPSLSPAMDKVVEILVADPGRASKLTISALAQEADTSVATVTRLCQVAGFSGYPQLRIALAREAGGDNASGHGSDEILGADIAPEDDVRTVIEKMAFADSKAIRDSAAVVSAEQLTLAVEALRGARHVAVFGVGASGFVASDLQLKLNRVGRPAMSWSDVHVALLSSTSFHEGDVAVLISHSGETRETVDVEAALRGRGVTTVAICNHPQSVLARRADCLLLTAGMESQFRSGATASRIAQLFVIDALFVAVVQRDFERSMAAVDATLAVVQHQQAQANPSRGDSSE